MAMQFRRSRNITTLMASLLVVFLIIVGPAVTVEAGNPKKMSKEERIMEGQHMMEKGAELMMEGQKLMMEGQKKMMEGQKMMMKGEMMIRGIEFE